MLAFLGAVFERAQLPTSIPRWRLVLLSLASALLLLLATGFSIGRTVQHTITGQFQFVGPLGLGLAVANYIEIPTPVVTARDGDPCKALSLFSSSRGLQNCFLSWIHNLLAV